MHGGIIRMVFCSLLFAVALPQIALARPLQQGIAGEAADTQARFVVHRLSEGEDAVPYQIWLPPGYTSERQWPLVMFLHGAGERGRDGQKPTEVGLGAALRESPERFPFIVLFPQCEESERPILEGWAADQPAAQRLLKILKQTEQHYAVDPDRRILTGWSMGGYGVWQLAAAWPDLWSALLPICSGGEAQLAERIPDVPIWAISGQRDNVVRPSAVQPVIDALARQNRSYWHTIVPDAGHDVWRTAYRSKDVQRWLQNPTSAGMAPSLQVEQAAAKVPADFEPALEISNAIGLRIGNRMLEAVSYAIPPRIPPSAISGRIPDIHDSTSANGIRFAVRFSGISYTGRVTDAKLQAAGRDRLSLAIALRDVNLTIGSTYIRGGRKSATAGPISIGIGTRRPVWLKIQARPYIANRELKLSVVDSEFRIDRDNWYVTRPYGVATRGWGMTESRVSNALVEGLYGRRRRIEQEVEAAVPSILGWVEDVIDFSSAGQAARAVWPLPVYSPVARAWPQTVSVDEQGVTLTLGLDVAAPTDQPLRFRTSAGQQQLARALQAARNSTLAVAIDPTILEPLSELLVDSNIARINVLDIPGDAFAQLTDRRRLGEILPSVRSLPPVAEIKTELVLPEPLQLHSVAGATQQHLLLGAPTALVEIATRPDSSTPWSPAATLGVSLQQRVGVSVETEEEFSKVRVVPAGDVAVSAVNPVVAEQNGSLTQDQQTQLLELFSHTWNKWLQGQVLNEARLPSLDFQQTRLLLQKIDLRKEAILAAFNIPPIRIENLTDQDHAYQVKSPTGGWSETRVLSPGEFHRYDIEYSLTYRWTHKGTTTVYTLKPGSKSEFRVPVAGGDPTLFRKRVR